MYVLNIRCDGMKNFTEETPSVKPVFTDNDASGRLRWLIGNRLQD